MLRGRRAECGVLDGLLEGVRGGRSAALVVRGEAGVGKTALLDYAVESARDLGSVRAAGSEPEMELAFAGLHQLCGPMLDRLGLLPGPQRDALRIAFGLEAGTAPDRFLVGLAVLSLLSEAARDRPLVCVLDDVQWLDRASVQVLAFAARRLLAEAVLVIFADREPRADLRGLPELTVEGLCHADARELLGSVVRWPLDEQVANRLVTETRGNPLALLELPRGISPAELAGGARSAPYAAMLMASLRGDHAKAAPLIETTIAEAAAGGHGAAATYAHWAAAILYNGLGRYADALAAAQYASQEPPALYMSMWALPELVEAATRCGKSQLAARALERLTETTRPGGTDFGLGIEARSRALVSEGAVAEGRYREAIDRLGRTQLRPELARAHLLYGEWLRRAGRRTDAREQLREAYEMLTVMGIGGFAERARRELLATGENVRKRRVETTGQLTAQEAQIARLAGDGLSNQEISTQLFLSPRTVEWHLRKVFAKLGISSRRQLRAALPDAGHRSRTRSSRGCEQQISMLPSAGSSTGSGA